MKKFVHGLWFRGIDRESEWTRTMWCYTAGGLGKEQELSLILFVTGYVMLFVCIKLWISLEYYKLSSVLPYYVKRIL